MDSFESLPNYIAPPVRPINRSRLPSTYFAPPIKQPSNAVDVNRFIAAAPRPPRQPLSSDYIASKNTAIQTKRRRRRSVPFTKQQNVQKPKEICAPSLQDSEFDDFDDSGFGDWLADGDWPDGSPVKTQDSIDWSITSSDIEKLKLDVLPCYWEHLLDSVNSIVRVTKRLYVLQDWDYKGHLVAQHYRHVYRMVDVDGLMGASCDCKKPTSNSRCIHVHLIEQYYSHFDEPVVDGEEPGTFLVNLNYDGLRYLFSVATLSGSERNHSHKRTIVTCNMSNEWRCRSCRHAPECRHITACQDNLTLLPQLGDQEFRSIEETAELIVRSRPRAIVRRCISHLPIPPPLWAQLPTDEVVNKVLRIWPTLFPFPADETARCSCGNRQYNAGKDLITTNPFIVYGSTTAKELAIQTVYCSACSNTHGRIGPDLGEYGILNWNNKFGFSHQLLNQYTSHLTHSETPFNAYYHTIEDEYLNNQSPIQFCDDETFEHAWFLFIRLQQLQSSMRCSQCGENPKVVIADGVSISFPGHHRTETLRPPTVSNQAHVWVQLPQKTLKLTGFSGPKELRGKIYSALNASTTEDRLKRLHTELNNLIAISRDGEEDYTPYVNCLTKYYSFEDHEEYQHLKYTRRYKHLLLQIFSSDSVLQIVPHAAIPLLLEYSATGRISDKLPPLIPGLGMLFVNRPPDHLESKELQGLSLVLANRAHVMYEKLVQARHNVICNTHETPACYSGDWEDTGSFYGRPPLRHRPYYQNKDNINSISTDNSEPGFCKKFYSTYKKKQSLTGGLMAFWCQHLICLGFHKIPKAEGRNDVFSGLYVYFDKAPDVVVYDFACQLGDYAMSREPEFFKDTLFVVDEMHAKGHSACSQASFSSNYMQCSPRLQEVNTSAAECSNSGLSRIRKSVSYMSQNHAIRLTYVYICVWNRRRERDLQMKKEKERNRLQVTVNALIV